MCVKLCAHKQVKEKREHTEIRRDCRRVMGNLFMHLCVHELCKCLKRVNQAAGERRENFAVGLIMNSLLPASDELRHNKLYVLKNKIFFESDYQLFLM